MRRWMAISTMVIGVFATLFVVLENMGPFTFDVVVLVAIGVLVAAGGFVALRTSRMEYLTAIWGVAVGTGIGPLFSLVSDDLSNPNADRWFMLVFPLVSFSFGLIMLILSFIAAHRKEKTI